VAKLAQAEAPSHSARPRPHRHHRHHVHHAETTVQ
jgi:hypothetical protein